MKTLAQTWIRALACCHSSLLQAWTQRMRTVAAVFARLGGTMLTERFGSGQDAHAGDCGRTCGVSKPFLAPVSSRAVSALAQAGGRGRRATTPAGSSSVLGRQGPRTARGRAPLRSGLGPHSVRALALPPCGGRGPPQPPSRSGLRFCPRLYAPQPSAPPGVCIPCEELANPMSVCQGSGTSPPLRRSLIWPSS